MPELPLDRREGFTRDLMAWYRLHARALPWRGVQDPYLIWLSEIMLQQTRVAAVLEHYGRFVQRFPTLSSLASASEADVLTAWSGLGYYRRARMMHRAAQLLMEENGGTLPGTAVELRRLPGIGTYTSAAIASIAFGEPIAVVDGNVERVLFRILGLPESHGAVATDMLNTTAQSLLPMSDPGEHNQAMMELGATVCLPRGPLCQVCPVFAECRTRGEHKTSPRTPMQSERVSYGLATRKARGSIAVEVLLQHRPKDVSLMAGMLELPQMQRLADDAESTGAPLVLLQEPVLRVRHAIVGTNYYVEIMALSGRRELTRRALRRDGFEWVATRDLINRPLTGLARKVLQRLRLMRASGEERTPDMPLLIGRASRVATGEEA